MGKANLGVEVRVRVHEGNTSDSLRRGGGIYAQRLTRKGNQNVLGHFVLFELSWYMSFAALNLAPKWKETWASIMLVSV